MSLNSKVPMSMVDLKQLTSACDIHMDVHGHQDSDEFLKIVIERLLEEERLANEITNAFQCTSMLLKRCLDCGELQDSWCEEHSINLPVLSATKYDLESLIYSSFCCDVGKGSMICKTCDSKPRHHSIKVIRQFPRIMFIILQRNEFDVNTHMSRVVSTQVSLPSELDMNFSSMIDLGGSRRLYELRAVITRTGGKT